MQVLFGFSFYHIAREAQNPGAVDHMCLEDRRFHSDNNIIRSEKLNNQAPELIGQFQSKAYILNKLSIKKIGKIGL